jgi:hypothetical protein
MNIMATGYFIASVCRVGMRAIQGSFPCLKDKMLFSESMEDQKAFLHMISMLLNFQTHHVGLNQLASTYYPNFHLVGDDVLNTFKV